MSNFPCNECGACCKSLKGIESFSELDRGDGVCKHFNDLTKRCSIYNERPLLCNIDKAYVTLFADQMSKEQYYEINIRSCNELQEKQGQVPGT